jgi:hypothetical protein
MSSSVGKRQRERQKIERAQAKAERKAARQATDSDETTEDFAPRSETELMEDLAALHRAFEASEISLEDFEARRDRIQAQFEQILP